MHIFIQFNAHMWTRRMPSEQIKEVFYWPCQKNERNCVDLQLRGTMFTEPLHCIFFATTISIKSNAKSWPGAIYPPHHSKLAILYSKNWKLIQWSKKVSIKNFCMQLAIKTTLMSGQDVLRFVNESKNQKRAKSAAVK